MRLDFNVSTERPDAATGQRRVEDDNRIVESLPTIKYALEKGARLVLASTWVALTVTQSRYSMEPVASRLAVLLGIEVTLADDWRWRRN